jgi:hypothetical protein
MTTNTTTFDLEDCPCCAEGEPCEPDLSSCAHCDTQLKLFYLEFSGVVTESGCDCTNDVDDFWNSTSFINGTCCDCECGQSRVIPDPDDDFIMGHTNVIYEATQVTVVVDDLGTAQDYTDCPCADSTTTFQLTGLTAPYDCENQVVPFLSQGDYPSGGGVGPWRTDWSGASCTLSAA